MTGVVQVVGFRWFVREVARAAGLAGMVVNTDDGAVEVFASGSTDALAQLADALAVGPAGARVHTVTAIAVPDHEDGRTLAYPFAIGR